MRVVFALLVSLASAVTAAFAQARGPEIVPRELVAALMSHGEVGDVRVGTLAPGFPVEALPPSAPVLGSLVFPNTSTTVFVVGEARDAALETFQARITAAGWRRAYQEYVPPQGFVPRTYEPPRNTFCRGDEYLSSAVVPGRQYAHLLKIHHNRVREMPRCGQQPRRRSWMMEDTPMPTLVAPPGSEQRGGGGGGGSEDMWETSAGLVTAMDLSGIVAHYGPQLQQAGWSAGDAAAAGNIAVQFWRLSDAEAGKWWGVFTATAVPESSLRFVSFRIGREDATRQ